MSVVEDVEQDGGTVLQYAPRHLRYPEQQSIRPILERLNRGDGDAPPEPARAAEPIPFEPPRRRIGWQLVACSALSAGLSAGLAVLAIGWLAPGKPEFTRIDAIQLDPKAVHTVSFKQDPPPAPARSESPPAAPAESDLVKQPEEAAPPIQPKDAPPPAQTESRKESIAPKELLALWSGVPADLPAEAATTADASAPAIADEAQNAEAEAPAAPQTRHRAGAATRHPHVRHRSHVRRAAAAHTQAQTTGQSASASAQPANSNGMSALQSLFSRSAQQTNGASSGSQ